MLAGHLREAKLIGLAGAYIFSWTDDWHTGGHPIEDWAFGITYADRTPKPSFRAVVNVFKGNQAATRGGSGSISGSVHFLMTSMTSRRIASATAQCSS
jgi:hypothetical protein